MAMEAVAVKIWLVTDTRVVIGVVRKIWDGEIL